MPYQRISGNPLPGLILMYPDDCLQALFDNWWIEDNNQDYALGRLLWAFVPHVDQVPSGLFPEGRNEPTNHATAKYLIKPIDIKRPRQRPNLPVAAFPDYPNEIRVVYRAKKRPGLVVGGNSKAVPNELRRGYPRWQTSPTILVAPYYGIESTHQRGGWPEKLVERIRHCEYPQYFWDKLPLPGETDQSVLRLDHIQPIGTHHQSLEWTKFRLCDEAMELLKEQITWLLWGNLPEDSDFLYLREELLSL